MSELRKDVEESSHGLVWGVILAFVVVGDWKKISPDSWSPDQNLYLQPPYALNHDILCVVLGTDYTSFLQI